MDRSSISGAGSPMRPYSSGNKVDYIGFVEDEGHRNIVRADTVTIMRKMRDGSFNLHISGYSYAKRTHDLQAFQTLDEAFAWMDLLPSTPLSTPTRGSSGAGIGGSLSSGPDEDTSRDSVSNSTSASGVEPS
eukprot:m.69869 g.69869  ORF g.69869 m.69869 type:complete len:132 (-) comp18438_c0_seq1:1723-2118(-)